MNYISFTHVFHQFDASGDEGSNLRLWGGRSWPEKMTMGCVTAAIIMACLFNPFFLPGFLGFTG